VLGQRRAVASCRWQVLQFTHAHAHAPPPPLQTHTPPRARPHTHTPPHARSPPRQHTYIRAHTHTYTHAHTHTHTHTHTYAHTCAQVVHLALKYGAAFSLRDDSSYDGVSLFDRAMSCGAPISPNQWPLCLCSCILMCARLVSGCIIRPCAGSGCAMYPCLVSGPPGCTLARSPARARPPHGGGR